MSRRLNEADAAGLVALRRLRQRRAEAAHAAAAVRVDEAAGAAETAEAAHRDKESAWIAAIGRSPLAFTIAGAWGALLQESHAGVREAEEACEAARTEQGRASADAARAAAETDLASQLARRAARRRRRDADERALAAYQESAAGQGKRP